MYSNKDTIKQSKNKTDFALSGSDVINIAGFAHGVYVLKNGKQVTKVVIL